MIITQLSGDVHSTSRVVVAIPAYEEEDTIARVIVGARRQADAVIVCDDGSSDMTREIAEALGFEVVRHERNMGKGKSLKDLVEKAKLLHPAVVVTMDADSQHDPSDIPRVVRPILEGEADIVVGIRDMVTGAAPRHRVLGNKMLDLY